VGEPGNQSTSARNSGAVQCELSVTIVGLAELRECATEMSVCSAKADISNDDSEIPLHSGGYSKLSSERN